MTERSSVEIFDENYAEIKRNIAAAAERSGRSAADITLLAATKTVDVDTINHAIKSGITHIGENRVQELLAKDAFYAPVHKHMIGHLQTNKVKDIIDRVEMIESVDSLHLAAEISKQAVKRNKVIDVLVEINIGNEESKSGFSPQEAAAAAEKIAAMDGIFVRGLMSIPPVCEKSDDNRKYFEKMHNLFIDIAGKKIDNSSMDFLSMGMSDDYAAAIEEGANLVRIGTALFGRRNYGTAVV